MSSGVYIRTEEHNRKNSEGHIGLHHSKQTIQRIREGNQDKYPSEETKEKMRGPRPSMQGENHPQYGKTAENGVNWQGGNGGIYNWNWSMIADEARLDHCEDCNISQEDYGVRKLDVHHRDGNHRNDGRDNLRTLCSRCHKKADKELQLVTI